MSNESQSQYAADVLFIGSLFCAKIATAMMTMSISQRSHKRVIQCVELFVLLWAGTGILVVFFQCQMPTPWYYIQTKCIHRVCAHSVCSQQQHCANQYQVAFWAYFSAVNIITDILLIAIMVENVRRIQTSWSKKIMVICVFGSRIL